MNTNDNSHKKIKGGSDMVSFIFINQFCMLVIKKKCFGEKKKTSQGNAREERRDGGGEERDGESGKLFCASPFE